MRKRLVLPVVVSLLSGLLTGGVAEAAALAPTLVAKTTGATSAEFSVDPGPGAAEIESITYDFGDGSITVPVQGNRSWDHSYLDPGTYEVSAEVVDVDGNRATAATSYTTAGSGYAPFGPRRVLDTRSGLGAPLRKLAPRSALTIDVNGLSASATAVVVNVTVTNTTAAGWVVAYPAGRPRPNSSVVDYTAGATVSNATIVGVGGSSLSLYNGGAAGVDVIVDVTGYFEKAGERNGIGALVTPVRLLDTRSGTGPVPAGRTIELNVDTTNAPFRPTAVALNVTAVDPAASGFVTAFPAGTPRPASSSLNFHAGRTVANLVIVPVTWVDEDRSTISLYTNATTQLLVDVTGYLGDGTAHFVPVNPTRVIDTRVDFGLAGPLAPRSSNAARTDAAAPNLGIEYAMIGSAKAVNATRSGFLGAGPFSHDPPRTSLLNFDPGTVTGNFFLHCDGSRQYFYNGSSGTVDVVVDAFGYFYDQ